MSLDTLLPVPTEFEETPWTLPVQHLSATQLAMAARCPEQWRRRYILGEKARPHAALVWGSADHYAHEQNFVQKIDSHEDITEKDVQEAFAEGFYQAVERNGGDSEIEWDDKPGEVLDRGVELAAVYHRQVSPRVQPIAVETKFEVHVPKVAVPVIGYVDVETETLAIERKTAKRMERTVKPEWSTQGLLYRAVHGKPIEWHLSVKTKTPAVYTPEEQPGLRLPENPNATMAMQRLVQVTAGMLLSFWERFGPNEPWPGTRAYGWACGFCGYKPTCFWWAA